MKIVVLLALLGLAASSPMTWDYKYSADMGSHNMGQPSQMSGTKLVADLKVTISANHQTATFKMSNLKMCQINGVDTAREGRTPVRCNPAPLPDTKTAQQLEKPFAMEFGSNGEPLKVPKDDVLWMSNIRKGIASTLRVPSVLSLPVPLPASSNRLAGALVEPTSFEKIEEVVHGKCLIRYTITPLEKSAEVLRQDAQQLAPSMYKVVKSVDLTACDHQVVLAKSSHGNYSEAADGLTRGLASRSSVGHFHIRGTPSTRLSTRVERAIVEGSYTWNPIGKDTKKTIVVTNQTLTLTKATLDEELAVPVDLVGEMWSFRALSPNVEDPQHPVRWITFAKKAETTPIRTPITIFDLLGLPNPRIDSPNKESIEKIIEELVKKVSAEMPLPNKMHHRSGEIMESMDSVNLMRLHKIVDLLQTLPSDSQEKIHNALQTTRERTLLVQTMRSSGSSSSFQVIIKLMQEKKLTEEEIIAVFSTINVGAFDPVMVADLVNFVTSKQEFNTITTKSAVLINLSTMVRRMCVLQEQRDFVFPKQMYGLAKCTTTVDQFVDYLKKMLEETRQESERAIYTQALANVGTQKCMEVLAEVARGKKFPNNMVLQLVAINGITKNHMQNSSYEYARRTLLSIVENEMYEPEFREAAVVSLFTMPQNASMWQRLAAETWRHCPGTSQRVHRFIYSYIKSVAESMNPHFMHKINKARHALSLAKPVALKLNDAQYWSSSQFDSKYDAAYNMELIHSIMNTTQTPGWIKAKFIAVIGGMKYPLVHGSLVGKQVNQRTLDSAKVLFSGLLKQQLTRSPQFREALSYLESNKNLESVMHTTFLKDTEFFTPISGDYIEELLRPQQSLVSKILGGQPTELAFYSRLVDNWHFVPNDIGLPILIRTQDSVMLYANCQSQTVGETANKLTLQGNVNFKLASTVINTAYTILPWKSNLAGVQQNFTTMVPPVNFKIEFDTSKTDVKIANYELSVAPAQKQQQMPILAESMAPFTCMEDLIKPTPTTPVRDYRLVMLTAEYSEEYPILPPEIMNITLGLRGNVLRNLKRNEIFPIRPMDIVEFMTLPTIKPWQVVVYWTPVQQSKKLVGNFIYASKSQNVPVSQISAAMPMAQDLNIRDTVEQRLQKWMSSPALKMVSASVALQAASSSKKYEMVHLIHHQQVQELKKVNHQMVLMTTESPNQACLCSGMSFPILPEAQRALREYAPAELTSQIFSGQRCQAAAHALTIKAKAEVSQERKMRVQNLQSSVSQGLRSQATKPIYDKLVVEVEKMKPLSPIIEQVIDMSHHFMYPSFESSSIQSSSNKMAILKASRSLETDRVSLKLQTPRYVSVA